MTQSNDKKQSTGPGGAGPSVGGDSQPERPVSADQPAADQPPPPEPVQAELDELMDKLKRVTADYMNYQKRTVREMAEARKYANFEFAREMLTVVDDLERAMAAGEGSSAGAILDGVRITHEHMMTLLARHGVTVIQAAGRPFDPQVHEAMMQQPSETAAPGTVLEALTRGYRMHERTLRPARVVVAKAPEENNPSP